MIYIYIYFFFWGGGVTIIFGGLDLEEYVQWNFRIKKTHWDSHFVHYGEIVTILFWDIISLYHYSMSYLVWKCDL